MAQWSGWDWIAYACLGVAAIGLALGSITKEHPAVSEWLPSFFSRPLWAYVPAVMFVIATAIFIVRIVAPTKTAQYPTPIKLEAVIGQTFSNSVVVIDGKRFDDCVFDNVTIRWNGGPYSMFRVTISGRKRLEVFDPKVVDTIDMLKGLGFLETSFAADWKHIPPATR